MGVVEKVRFGYLHPSVPSIVRGLSGDVRFFIRL